MESFSISDIASIGTLITTIVLVIITFNYAKSTNKMMQIMNLEFNSKFIPYLLINKEMKIINSVENPDGKKISCLIKNICSVPIRFKCKSLIIESENISMEEINDMLILPNEELTFMSPDSKVLLGFTNGILKEIIINVQFIFWSDLKIDSKFCIARKQVFKSMNRIYTLEETLKHCN